MLNSVRAYTRSLFWAFRNSSQRGLSLIQVIISAGIVSVISVAILSLSNPINRGTGEGAIRMTAENLKRNLVNYLQDTNSWTNTVNLVANANLACLKNSTDCAAASGTFQLMNGGAAGGTLIYNPTAAANGFDLQGATCSTFDTTNTTGNNKCPFRVDITWTPICPVVGSCISPGVRVTGTFYYRPKKMDQVTDFPMNPSKYSFSTTRGATLTSQGTGTADYLAKWSSSTALNDSIVYDASGKIGIGTTTPLAYLQVVAPATGSNATLILDGSLTDNKNSLLFRNSYWSTASDAYGLAYIRAIDSGTQGGHLAFATTANSSGTTGAPTERMRILQSGNVGIGSITPATTLDVNGQIRGGFVSHSSLNTNWSSGNIQLTSVAAGTLTFTSGSMFDGTDYTLILTSAGTFTLGNAGDVTTWKCAPDCASNQIVATGHTVLTIVKSGTTGYVVWAPGYAWMPPIPTTISSRTTVAAAAATDIALNQQL